MDRSHAPPAEIIRFLRAGRTLSDRPQEALAALNGLSGLPRFDRARAEAFLAAGHYREGLETARRAVAAAEAAGTPRRRVEAWTALGYAQSLAETRREDDPDAYATAQALVGEAGLARTLAAARLARRRASSLSGAGELAAAGALLDGLAWLRRSPTRRGRREALHVETVRAGLLLRGSEAAAAAAAFAGIAERRTELLGPTHPETLTALHNQAVALRRTARRSEALLLLGRVAAARSTVIGRDHPDTLVTCSFLALQEAEGGDPAAIGEIAAILAEARRCLGDTHSVVLQIAGRVASIQGKAGRPRDALATLGEWAPRSCDALGAEHPEAGSLLHEYGGALREAGQLAQAYEIFSQLAEATRRHRGDAHIETLASFNNLAVVVSDLGDEATAEALYRAMLATFAQLGSAYALDEASVRTNLGHLLLTSGRAAEARRVFEAALAARERRLEPGHRLLHLSRGNLAAALAKLGRFDAALALHRTVLEDRTRLYGPDHPDTLSSLHNLASTLDESGHPADAVPLLRQAAEARSARLGPMHAHTIASRRALAGALLEAGQAAEAEAVYEDIRAQVETMRREGGLPDELRRSLFGQYVPAYRALAMLRAARGDASAVFAIAEQIKARTLLERISLRAARRARLCDLERCDRLRQFENRIAALDARIPLEGEPVARNALTIKRDEALRRWRHLEDELRRASPAYAQASETRQIRFDEAAGRLAGDETFLSLIVHGDRVAAVWVAAAGAGCLDLGRFPALSETVAALRALLSEPTGLAGLMAVSNEAPPRTIWTFPDGSFRLGEPDTPPQAGARVVSDGDEVVAALSRRLLAPLPPEVFATRRLLISPDGPLTAIPFEALFQDGRRLVETHEVTHLASLSLAATRTRGPSDPETTFAMVAIGAPAFGPRPDRPSLAAIDSALAAAARRRGTKPTAWADLPGAAAELAAVKRIYGLVDGETLLTGEAATIERVRDWAGSGRLGRAAVILFASHGQLVPYDPRRNALVLASESPAEDGLLTAAELAGYDLSADLVVLSACDSGAGPYQAGEGLLGLPFALTAAGCQSVIQTLWPIYDAASAILVTRFFILYRAGIPASAALNSVKREMLAGDHGQAFAQPAYWAPYLLYG